MTPVVMLTYNSLALTREAVRSVLAQDVPTHLIVVDNNSTDGTREWLRTLPTERVTVMALAENRGVSAAWNLALRQVFDRERAQAAVVVNSDVVLRPDTVRTLVERPEPFVTAVGVNSLAESQGPWQAAPRQNPDFSSFCITRRAWMRVGEFDERMVNWFSDGDMHIRLVRAGLWAGTCGIPFYHVAAATVKSARGAEERNRWRDLFECDRAEFQRKWGGLLPGTKEYERMTTLTEAAGGPAATAAEAGAGTAAAAPESPESSSTQV